MAQPQTLNPYGMIGAEIDPGLTAIITALPSPATATVDDLVEEVFNYISSRYYPSPSRQTETQIKSISYHVINSFRNNLVLSGNARLNGAQAPFIQMLIGNTMTSNLPAISFADRIADIEDNIGTSELTVNEQIPLFLATTVGYNAYRYWLAELAKPTSDWLPFFSTTPGEDYINTLYWGVATMNGALAGFGATPQGLISPTTDLVEVDFISALIGALTITAGKVMFKWIPRITKPLSLQSSVVSNLTGVITPGDPGVEPDAFTYSLSQGWRCMESQRLTAGNAGACGYAQEKEKMVAIESWVMTKCPKPIFAYE